MHFYVYNSPHKGVSISINLFLNLLIFCPINHMYFRYAENRYTKRRCSERVNIVAVVSADVVLRWYSAVKYKREG